MNQESAHLDGYPAFPIDRTHSLMTKFINKNDPGYMKVLGEISRHVARATEETEPAEASSSEGARYGHFGSNYGQSKAFCNSTFHGGQHFQ